MLRKLFILTVVSLVTFVAVVGTTSMKIAQAGSGSIPEFSVDSKLNVHIRVSCPGNVGFTWQVAVDSWSNVFYEEGSAGKDFTMDGNKISNGHHNALARVRCSGEPNNWSSATTSTVGFDWYGGNPTPIPPPKNYQVALTMNVSAGIVAPNAPVQITVQAACSDTTVRAIRISADGKPFYELGSPVLTATWSSSVEGNHILSAEAACNGDDTWKTSPNAMVTVTVRQNPPPTVGVIATAVAGTKIPDKPVVTTAPDHVSCTVEQFSISPSTSVVKGTKLMLTGKGNCSNGLPRASKFTINGNAYAEKGSGQNQEVLDTSQLGDGSHQICFLVAANGDNDWSRRGEQCQQVVVGSNRPPVVDKPKIPEAQQKDPPGGVDLIYVCYAYGYTGARNVNHRWDGWQCLKGNDAWSVDWNKICQDVYGNSYMATRIGDGEGDIRCVKGNQLDKPMTPNPVSPEPPDGDCSPKPSRVKVGDIAVNTSGVTLHAKPNASTRGGNNFTVPAGAQFTIVSGPVCGERRTWWEIGYNGQGGWLPESNDETYNFTPNGTVNPPKPTTPAPQVSDCSGAKPVRMVVGGRGRVIRNDGTTISLRATPQGDVVTTMLVGQEFTVITGPQCTMAQKGHLYWWQVKLDSGTTGWLPEGYSDGDYWIEPIPKAVALPTVHGNASANTQSFVYVLENAVDLQLYAEPGNKPIGKLTATQYYELLRHNGKWLSINTSMGKGWIDVRSTTFVSYLSGTLIKRYPNGWCSAIPSALDNFGWSTEGHNYPNPRFELHFPPEVELNGPPEHYIYFNNRWVGPDVSSWTGWSPTENVWIFGIKTHWLLGMLQNDVRTAMLTQGVDVFDRNQWRVDYRCWN